MQIYGHKVMLTVCIPFKLTCNMPVSLPVVNFVILVVHLPLNVTMVFFIVICSFIAVQALTGSSSLVYGMFIYHLRT
jgi:hypothetical protein